MTMWVQLRPAAGEPDDLIPEELRGPMQVESLPELMGRLTFPSTVEPTNEVPVIAGHPVQVFTVARGG